LPTLAARTARQGAGCRCASAARAPALLALRVWAGMVVSPWSVPTRLVCRTALAGEGCGGV
ncbi:hypothetical protein NLR10_25080, partial [Escherichia coli]|nr:hypothetical protein [Escherichia coli]